MFSYSKFYEGRTPVLNKPPLSFLQAVSDKPVAGEAGPLGTAQAHSPAGMPLAMSFCCLYPGISLSSLLVLNRSSNLWAAAGLLLSTRLTTNGQSSWQ